MKYRREVQEKRFVEAEIQKKLSSQTSIANEFIRPELYQELSGSTNIMLGSNTGLFSKTHKSYTDDLNAAFSLCKPEMKVMLYQENDSWVCSMHGGITIYSNNPALAVCFAWLSYQNNLDREE